MSTLFTQVAEVFTRRQQKKIEDFDALVRAIMVGGKKPPTAAQIAEALDDAGKTPVDLEREVTRRQQRVEYARRFAEIPGLQKKMAQLEQAGAAEANRFRPLEEEHQETVRRLTGQAYTLEQQIAAAQGMQSKLLASYSGPLRDELASLGAKQREVNESIRAAEQTAAEHERAADVTGFSNSYPGTIVSDADVASRRLAAKTCRETAAELKKKLPPLIARAAEIQAEMLTA